jgi:hypothetical protein
VAVVTGFFAIALLIAGLRARDVTGRVFFLSCALLNAAASGHMISTNYEDAFRLAPNPNNSDEEWFRR